MLVVKNAQISAGKGNKISLVNIYIDKGLISHITISGTSSRKRITDTEINADGMLVLPGAIDPHVHFDTPGFEWREDFAHGTRAAAAGGVTTVIDMPDTSLPPVTNPENLEKKLTAIKDLAYVDYALWGGVSGDLMMDEDWMNSMSTLYEAGVVGFKTYLISAMDTFRDLSVIQLGQVMQYASKIGALVGLHAEEKDMIEARTFALKKAGKKSLFDFYFARSDPAEQQGVAIGLGLAKQTRCGLHIVHLASKGALELIKKGKRLEIDVSSETCPHYLQFTYKDFKKLGPYLKCAPVVKTERDRDALWGGLIDGDIDFASTDHASCRKDEKETDDVWTTYSGVNGVQTMLPYLFTYGYLKKRLSLARLIEVTSMNAAKRFGLYPQKGVIEVGSDADIVIIDPNKIWTVNTSSLFTRHSWTPFIGMKMVGEIVMTIVRGEVVYDREKGVIGKAGYGKWVRARNNVGER